MRWLGVRLQLLLTALIVLLASAAADRSQYFCKMMGRTVVECCCAVEHSQHRARRATVQAPDCCERLAASQQPLAITSHDATLPDFALAMSVATPPFTHPERGFRVLPALDPAMRSPPGVGPPLFISHCALLI